MKKELSLVELEAQTSGLVPDRVEMAKKKHGGGGATANAAASSAASQSINNAAVFNVIPVQVLQIQAVV